MRGNPAFRRQGEALKIPFISSLFESGPVVPVLRMGGPIGAITPLRPGLNLSTLSGSIQRAFSMKGAKAVAIQINSPGGSAVQSMLIYKRIRDLADEKGLPVYVFAEDVAASGGYLIALAGDEIYVDGSSIIGSIGVVAASFGFDKAIKRLGIQRRVYTAGDRKVTLDPFQPEQSEDVERLKALQQDVHESFVDLVKERRGRRIKKAGEDLFTGEFWSGKKAVELGLADGISDLRSKMREMLGKNVRLRLVTPRRSLFRRRLRGVFTQGSDETTDAGFAPPSLADDLISAIEARALWSRFGL